jgi:hypothetical protein
MMTGVVTEARPPAVVVRLLNPINRIVLRSPLGRAIKPVALLEFRGLRTGRRLRVPVLWHPLDGRGYVFSPASWPRNFADGHEAVVTHRGRPRSMRGTLTTDPAVVADAFNELLANGTRTRHTGLKIPNDHHVTATDVINVGRQLIIFEPA